MAVTDEKVEGYWQLQARNGYFRELAKLAGVVPDWCNTCPECGSPNPLPHHKSCTAQ